MIYLPSPRERYLAALRLYVQKKVLRGEKNEKSFVQLKKIMLCEAFVSKNEKSPVDIIKYSDSLLGAAVIILLQRGKRLSVHLSGGGAFLINRRLFTALLLTAADACGKAGDIFIFAEETRIIIKLRGIKITDLQRKLINALDGYVLKSVRSKNAITVLPTEETEEKPEEFQNEWEWLSDSFSAVNVFLMRNP